MRAEETEDVTSIKLIAQDSDDLDIISTLLQDGLVAATDIHFDQKIQCLMMLVNRFCWEKSADEQHYRCLCGVNIGHVHSLSYKNMLLQKEPSVTSFYNLLTFSFQPKTGALNLIFSNEGEIRCSIEKLDVRIKDVAAPYPTPNTPEHL